MADQQRDFICAECGVPFHVKGYFSAKRASAEKHYCSWECVRERNRRVAREQWLSKFWANIDRRGDDECWPWMGRKTKKGYGIFQAKHPGRTKIASRIAYIIANGDPGRLLVCHSCDNPPCCNPKHLWLGTEADNARDAAAKGRMKPHFPVGEHGFSTKLTAADIRAIRASTLSAADLADQYGVGSSQIWRIRRRAAWGHIE